MAFVTVISRGRIVIILSATPPCKTPIAPSSLMSSTAYGWPRPTPVYCLCRLRIGQDTASIAATAATSGYGGGMTWCRCFTLRRGWLCREPQRVLLKYNLHFQNYTFGALSIKCTRPRSPAFFAACTSPEATLTAAFHPSRPISATPAVMPMP